MKNTPLFLSALLVVSGGLVACESNSGSISHSTCQAGLELCGSICCAEGSCDENNVCHEADDESCGASHEKCEEGKVCNAGHCVAVEEACKSGQKQCKGSCVNVSSDPKNCGDCGHPCEDDETCKKGNCEKGCSNGFTLIDGQCYDTRVDSEHCGKELAVCGENQYCGSDPDDPAGEAGKCLCMSGYFDCDGDSKNGCESDVDCAYVCEDGEKSCGPGLCCDQSAICCGSSCCESGSICCGNGICADLDNDALNCGECGNKCGKDHICQEGKCVIHCAEDQDTCPDVCTDLNTDPHNCGECGNKCDSSEFCFDEGEGPHCVRTDDVYPEFQCNTEEELETEGFIPNLICWAKCIDGQTDVENCGACGNKCGENEDCKEGVCTPKPSVEDCENPAETRCYGLCVDLKNDDKNCGACLNACASGTKCEDGECVVQCGELLNCNNTCVDITNSVNHCGGCGNKCADGQDCVGGACQCADGRYDCDGLASNGCESTAECKCTPGAVQPCWRGEPENRNKGICKDGSQTCDASGQFWGTCIGGVYPSAVTCNAAGYYMGGDQNCNGIDDTTEDCVTSCDLLLYESSYIGCEYWPVFLQNYSGYSHVYMDMTVVVSNPNNTDAQVYIFDKAKNDNASHVPYMSFTVPAGGVVTKLVVGDAVGNTQDNTAVPNSGQTIYSYMMQNTMLAPYAFKLRSSLPVVVYQFNPYGKSNGYTADASLLLPSNVLGQDYIDLTYWTSSGDTSANVISIVAVKPGDTTVKVTPTIGISSGTNKNTNTSISAISANTERSFVLHQFDVLSLQQSASGEMTGSKIHADKPVAVFGGSACANIRSYCDHIEEQLFPTTVWGTNYYAIRAGYNNSQKKLLGSELDDYYILAQQDGTVVTITGNQGATKTDTINLTAYSGGTGVSKTSYTTISTNNNFTGTVTLNSGQFTKISTIKNFHVSATKPILVGQFIDDVGGIGDPGYTLNVPVEQYRKDYSFSIPKNYEYDFVTLVAPKNTKIYYTGAGYKGTKYNNALIDNLPAAVFSGWMNVGNEGYVYGFLDIDEGVHHLVGDKKFGALGYGFGNATDGTDDTSYAYPIGLNLDVINNNTND
ncbi:MAG: hypothetical protein IJU23_03795 [Proteobacteria bacterium]|nr:hypothetical protein [Pseudomonadota bacterium]